MRLRTVVLLAYVTLAAWPHLLPDVWDRVIDFMAIWKSLKRFLCLVLLGKLEGSSLDLISMDHGTLAADMFWIRIRYGSLNEVEFVPVLAHGRGILYELF